MSKARQAKRSEKRRIGVTSWGWQGRAGRREDVPGRKAG